jgi:hypothetical protein
MARLAYCFIENGQMLLGLNLGAGDKATEYRLPIDDETLELMAGAVREGRAEIAERPAVATVRRPGRRAG